MMLAALVVLVVAFSQGGGATQGAMFVYIGGYQVGFGPIAWLIISEVFPLEVRGAAVSVAVLSNFFWNVVVSFVIPIEMRVLGSVPIFGIFAVLTFLSLIFVHRCVPETEGLSLEEIEAFFRTQQRQQQQQQQQRAAPLKGNGHTERLLQPGDEEQARLECA